MIGTVNHKYTYEQITQINQRTEIQSKEHNSCSYLSFESLHLPRSASSMVAPSSQQLFNPTWQPLTSNMTAITDQTKHPINSITSHIRFYSLKYINMQYRINAAKNKTELNQL